MLKRLMKTIVISLCLIFNFQPVQAQDISMDVDVIIALAASASKASDLNFGTLFVDPGGDNFVLDATGQSTADTTGPLDTADGMSTTGGTKVSGAVGTSGQIDLTTTAPNVTVTITAPDVVLSPVGASTDTITVQNIAANSSGAGAAVPFPAAGNYELHIGGDLVITAGLQADTYQGTVVVTLAYN